MKLSNQLKIIVLLGFFAYNDLVYAVTNLDLGIVILEFEPAFLNAAARKKMEAEKLEWSCQFNLDSFIDSRDNKETIGVTPFSRSLRARDSDIWLDDFELYLQNTVFDDSANIGKQPATVDIDLIRLYAHELEGNVLGVVAVKILIEQGVKQEEMYLRGYGALKYGGSSSSYIKAINQASHDLAGRVAEELNARCD